jgi:hypothetical protein
LYRRLGGPQRGSGHDNNKSYVYKTVYKYIHIQTHTEKQKVENRRYIISILTAGGKGDRSETKKKMDGRETRRRRRKRRWREGSGGEEKNMRDWRQGK